MAEMLGGENATPISEEASLGGVLSRLVKCADVEVDAGYCGVPSC